MKKGEVPKAPGQKDPQASSTVKTWHARWLRGCKVYDKWAQEYDVKWLEKYYLGKQWRGLSEEEGKRKYAINLIFATVETQLPSLLFSNPAVMVEARPDHQETPGSNAGSRASLIQHLLQTFIDDPDLHFEFTTTLSLRDAYPRFAMLEVGYSADYIDNPNADKPVLKDDDAPMLDGNDEPILQPKRIVKPGSKESLFLKRIPPQSFRCSPGRNVLEENDWVGYYDYQYVDDVKRNRDYQNTADLKGTDKDTYGEDESDIDHDRPADGPHSGGMIKILKIWDLRTKTRIILAAGHDKILQSKAFTFLPLSDLKFYEIGDSYYPLPPLYNWISPQDEINEQREQAKTHRRRFNRRYMREPLVTAAEFEKLESGDDGVCIEVGRVNPSPIMPIPDAELGNSNWTQLAASHDDFNQISGVGGEARGMPEADTATQANIINVRAQVRESRARNQVAKWLAAIARKMLLAIRENMQQPMMVKRSIDPATKPGTVAARAAVAWQQIKTEDIDELDVDIKIDLASLSPVAEDAHRQQWNIVLQLMTNPALFAFLMEPDPEAPEDPSPQLRKTLTLNGVKSEQEIRIIWRIGRSLQAKVMAAAAAQQNAPTKPEPMKISLALKGEDLSNPLVMTVFAREEQLNQQLLASQAQPASPLAAMDQPGAAAPVIPDQAGPTTGTPSIAPAT